MGARSSWARAARAACGGCSRRVVANFVSHDLPLLLAVVALALPGDDLASEIVVFWLHAEHLLVVVGFPPLVVEFGGPSDLVRDLPIPPLPYGRGAARGGRASADGDELSRERFIQCRTPRGRVVRARGRAVYGAAAWRI